MSHVSQSVTLRMIVYFWNRCAVSQLGETRVAGGGTTTKSERQEELTHGF